MLLKKKIALSFLISASIIAILVVVESVNFIQLRKHIRFLETTDTIRSKSLQLRRHEKNFFLYGSVKGDAEARAVHNYIGELNDILNSQPGIGNREGLRSLHSLIDEYDQRFRRIETLLKYLSLELAGLRSSGMTRPDIYPLVELAFFERPLQAAEFLEKQLKLPPKNGLISGLRELDTEIAALRKNGEDILAVSKELDKFERDNAESVVRTSQVAVLVLFSIFLVVGIGTLFYITSGVVKKLGLLTDAVEKTGKGYFSPMTVSEGVGIDNDEVGVLIRTFNLMEEHLAQREKELIQSKKLAAIGTLASGVAHELNNPLNNIYTTSQRLLKKAGDDCPPVIRKSLHDIYNETMRVKKIVGDLLGFARGRDPHFRQVELGGIIEGVYRHLVNSAALEKIRFTLDIHPREVVVEADQEQLEQVFINLFTNAVDAMSGEGELVVLVNEAEEDVRIKISDTGRGMSTETAEKIFEPFYTTKDKGTGLGLAIVFNIIQKHSGRIDVESAEGRGTTFKITLPKRAGAENAKHEV